MDEKNLKPLSDTAVEILTLYRQLSEGQQQEFIALVKELSSTMPKEASAGPASTCEQDS